MLIELNLYNMSCLNFEIAQVHVPTTEGTKVSF
jgi:hypothetical protein